MGSCLLTVADKASSNRGGGDISSQKTKKVAHIPLFGTRSSGKTTFLKQLDYICNDGANISEITDDKIIKHIRQSCVDNIIKLALCELNKYQKSIQRLNKLSVDIAEDLPPLSRLISDIWSQQSIKKRYAFRYHYTVDGRSFDDNMQHFFDQIDDVMSVGYVPTENDIIKYKTKNAEITSISNTFRRFKKFVVVDSGDYKDFETLNNNQILQTAKFGIFVASLSDFTAYNMRTKKFAMQHSLDLFENVVKSTNYDIVLLLSKIDIFKECLKKGISLRHCFGMEWEGGKEYINTNTTNLKYATILSKQAEQQIDKIVPNELVVIIQQYLYIEDISGSDEEYFELCCDEALEFIKRQYLKRCTDLKHRVWSQNVNLIDREWTSNKLNIILGVQNVY